MADLAVVIPAFNEEQSIASTIEGIRSVLTAAGLDYEIVVVNDGSSDETGRIARELGAHVVDHQRNRGYGAALKSGIRATTAAYIGIVDADGSYPIDRLPDLYDEAVRTGSEHVIGARSGDKVHDTPGRWVARRVLRLIAFIATGTWIEDLNSGMRVFSRSVALQYWSIYPNGFSFTTTITIATLQSEVGVRFVPIDYYQRRGRSHIRPVRDFFRFLGLIVRISFMYSPLRFFAVPGAILFSAGLGLSVFQVLSDDNLTDLAVITLLFGGQLLLNGLIAESLAQLHRRPAI